MKAPASGRFLNHAFRLLERPWHFCAPYLPFLLPYHTNEQAKNCAVLVYRSQYICVIDHAWGQDAWILSKFLFAFSWTEAKSRSIKTQKRTRPIHSYRDLASLVNKGFIIWLAKERTFSCGTNVGNPKRVCRVTNRNKGFALSCPLAEPATQCIMNNFHFFNIHVEFYWRITRKLQLRG